MKLSVTRTVCGAAAGLALLLAGRVQGGAEDEARLQAEAERVISPYKAIMDGPPQRIPSRSSVDAPLLGNGDMGAAIGGSAEKIQFWVCKNSFSKLRHDHRKGGPRPFGTLDFSFPALKGGAWHTEQEIFPAITTGRFGNGKTNVLMRTFLSATEDILVVEWSAEGATVEGKLALEPVAGRGSTEEKGEKDGVLWAKRTFHTDRPLGGTHPAEIQTSAGAAARILEGGAFKLEPGKKLTVALALQGNFDTQEELVGAATKMVGALTPEKVKELEQQHRLWWRKFWADSLVEFDEPFVQKTYYMANYVLGAAMRDKDFPPGLFGLWTTHDDPCWAGDYHLNFDYQSQFYGLYKNNHLAQADTYEQPVLDFMERGKMYAQKAKGIRGVYYPVGIWAKGMETSRQPTPKQPNTSIECGGVFLGQKTNAGYCLVDMAMRWYHTYDPEYAKKVYPFVVEVANFWEDYLQYEPTDKAVAVKEVPASTNAAVPAMISTIDGVPVSRMPVDKIPPGRYVVASDSIHENIHSGGDADMNSLLSLGLVHNAFTLALDMSKELGVDADRRARWEHILAHLSKFPTFEKDGKTVFRYTERGTEWFPDNSVGLQHIYPSGAIGLDDDPKLLAIGRNMIDAKNRWCGDNGENSFYPAAVRVGYDPATILKNLNMLFSTARKCINGLVDNTEQCSTLPNTINEMICMSHRQVLRLFPVWPKDKDARFWNLRAEGAFLVSSALKGGAVPFVKIHSEKGRDLTFVNPWPGKGVDVYRGGKKAETLKGDRITMKTVAGETMVLVAEGAAQPEGV